MTGELVKKWLISGLISGNLAVWTGACIKKVFFQCFWVPREINLRFCCKTQWQMFQLVSGRHVGTHPDGHQHGVSIQISINLDETLLRIARELKTAETWLLARLFILQSSIISQILEIIYRTVTIFSFDHMTDENQEYIPGNCTGA